MKKVKLLLVFMLVVFIFGNVYSVPETAKAAGTTHGYVSNAALDKHVIFQSFSLYQPYDGNDSNNMYSTLNKNTSLLKSWGITDVWMPPAYRAFSMSRYQEGYAMTDRYDLGEFNQGPNGTKATKYGTSDELKAVISGLHSRGLKVEEDLVPNQMLGLSQQQAVTVTRVDHNGNLFMNPFTTHQPTKIINQVYLAYTEGGGQGQEKYGYIPEWNKNYFNGTSIQGVGMGSVMKDTSSEQSLVPNNVQTATSAQPAVAAQESVEALQNSSSSDGYYHYYGVGNPKNNVPSYLDDAAKTGNINTVDSYLPANGWYDVGGGNWKPFLINDPDFQSFMKLHGFSTYDALVNGDNTAIADLLNNQYLPSKSQYSFASEEPSYQNDISGTDMDDELLFAGHENDINHTFDGQNEFLVGNDIDNANPTVQTEQKNWEEFLLGLPMEKKDEIGEYHFDGFRIDAASCYDTQILKDEAALMQKYYGPDLNDHLSYIESYEGQQNGFENSIGNGQLAYDSSLFYTLQNALGKASGAQALTALATNSAVNRTYPNGQTAIPNWSFVTNHDQEKNRVNKIMEGMYGITPSKQYGSTTPKSFQFEYDKGTEAKALDVYENDMASTVKKYAPYNVVSSYAYLLTNKDTVPTVYYGDLFKTNGTYMQDRTLYYNPIVNLLKLRQQYVSGNQKVTYYKTNTSSQAGKDLISSVRYGASSQSGVAVVIGNNPNTNTTVKVDMGKQHANQLFTDATGFNKQQLATDNNGTLTVPVKGISNPIVHGYLGVWVPGQSASVGYLTSDQAIRTSPSTKSSSIATVKKGTAVQVLASGVWNKILYNNQIAYINGSHSVSKTRPVLYTGYLTKDQSIRTSPSTNNRPIATLKKGSTVQVLANGTWYTILYNNRIAYVNGSVSMTQPVLYTGYLDQTQAMHTGAWVRTKVIKTLPAGSTVSVQQPGRWARVSYRGSSYYIWGADVKKPWYARLTRDTKLYTSTSFRSRSFRNLHKNSTITVINSWSYWVQVVYNGRIGYVWKSYIQR